MKFIPIWLIVFVALLLMAGMVVDGNGKTLAFQQALSTAQQAARAGTNAATGSGVNGDALDLAAPAAVAGAQNYMQAAGVTGTVTVTRNQVVVVVDTTYTPRMLSAIGIGPIPIEATGSAALISN